MSFRSVCDFGISKVFFAERIWLSAKRALHVAVICTQRGAGGLAAHRGFGFGVGRVGWGHLCSRHWLPRVAVTARMPVGAYMLDGWLFLKRAHRRPARSTRGMGLPPPCARYVGLLGRACLALNVCFTNTRHLQRMKTRVRASEGQFLGALKLVIRGT